MRKGDEHAFEEGCMVISSMLAFRMFDYRALLRGDAFMLFMFYTAMRLVADLMTTLLSSNTPTLINSSRLINPSLPTLSQHNLEAIISPPPISPLVFPNALITH